jgi:hypothetical protein
LLRYQSLRNAVTVLTYAQGRRAEALEMLDQSMRMGRTLRSEADNALFVLFGHVFLQRVLQGAADPMMDTEKTVSRDYVQYLLELEPLSPEELSMRRAMEYEGWMGYQTTKAQLKRSFIFTFLLKPNLTANWLADSYRKVIELSQLDAPAYAQEQAAVEYPEPGPFEAIRNLGSLAMTENAANYTDYIAHGHVLNGRIMLLRAKADLLSNETPNSLAQDVLNKNVELYYNIFTGEPLQWDAEDEEIYYETDLLDEATKGLNRIEVELWNP